MSWKKKGEQYSILTRLFWSKLSNQALTFGRDRYTIKEYYTIRIRIYFPVQMLFLYSVYTVLCYTAGAAPVLCVLIKQHYL